MPAPRQIATDRFRSAKNFAEFNVANPSHSVALLDGFL